MNFLRSLLFNTYYAILTIIFGSLIAIVGQILPSRSVTRFLCAWNFLVIHGLRVFCGVKFKRIGNLPPSDRPYVIMSKHQSSWETFYLQIVFAPLSTILKKELLKLPFFGWGLRLLQPVAIDRSNPIQALKQVKAQGVERLRRGRNLLVFPEGTRMAPGRNGKYARSGADIAIAAGVAIVPVAHNAGHCWLNKKFTKHPGTISIVIGEPIETQNKTSRELTDQVQSWINEQQANIESTHAAPQEG